MKLMLLVEDLERIQFKLQMEAALVADDEQLAKRLRDVSLEVNDALFKAKAIQCDPAVSDSVE